MGSSPKPVRASHRISRETEIIQKNLRKNLLRRNTSRMRHKKQHRQKKMTEFSGQGRCRMHSKSIFSVGQKFLQSHPPKKNAFHVLGRTPASEEFLGRNLSFKFGLRLKLWPV